MKPCLPARGCLRLLLALAVGGHFWGSAPSQAATFTWIAPTGDWNVATNWNPVGVPSSTDTAILPGGTVMITNPQTVGVLELNGGFLTGPGTLFVEQNMEWISGGMVGGGGRVVVLPQAYLDIANTNAIVMAGWTLENRGFARWSGNAPWWMQTGAVLTNASYLSFETAQPILSSNLNVRIDNSGNFQMYSTTGHVVLNPDVLGTPLMTFNNSGSMAFYNGRLVFDRAVLNLADNSSLYICPQGTNPAVDFGVVEVRDDTPLRGNIFLWMDMPEPWPQNMEIYAFDGPWQYAANSVAINDSSRAVFIEQRVDGMTGWVLRVFSPPPTIFVQPMDWMGPPGEEVVLNVAAAGAEPLIYQWYLNDIPIPDAFDPLLYIHTIQYFDRGMYHCVVSNAYGSVSSTYATVDLAYPPIIRNAAVMGDYVVLTMETNGMPWYVSVEFATDPYGPWTASDAFDLNVTNNFFHFSYGYEKLFYRVAALGLPPYERVYGNDLIAYLRFPMLPGYNLVGNPIVAPDQTLNALIPVAPDGAMMLFPAGNGFETYYYDALLPGWVNEQFQPSTRVWRTLEGAYFYNPLPLGQNFAISLIGKMPQGEISVSIPPGKSILTLPIPSEPSMVFSGFPAAPGDKLWTFENYLQTFWPHVFTNAEWSPTPYLSGSGAFWIESAPSAPSNRVWHMYYLEATTPPLAQFQYQPAVYTGPEHPLVPQSQTGPMPPEITVQPESFVVNVGEQASFSVTAIGDPPLNYQWFFEGMAIPFATNDVFIIPSAQLTDAGAYKVVVGNAVGSVTSVVATLQVQGGPPPPQVVAWGYNAFGQTNVPPDLTDVVAVSAGSFHGLALKRNGTVVGWGDVSVPPGLSNVVAVAGGGMHSVALLRDGTVVAWGDNSSWQANVPPGLSNVVAVAAGWESSLALRADGTVVAWGQYEEVQVPRGLTDVVAISGGGGHSLALKADGTVVAWGYNWAGQANVPIGLSNVVAIAAGGYHSLALRADGTVVAWGYNAYGQSTVPAGLSNVVAIAAGGEHSLAVRADGTVVAWGRNNNHQTDVPFGLNNVVAVAAGWEFSMVLNGVGLPYVIPQAPLRTVGEGEGVTFWGQATGQRPLNYQWYFNGEPIPGANRPGLAVSGVQMSDGGFYQVVVSNAVGVVTGDLATLELRPPTPKQIIGWGGNYAGVCTPPWWATGVVAVAAGESHVVALRRNGTVVGWGDNRYGQAAEPQGLDRVVNVAAGWKHSLALKDDGIIVSWGQSTVPSGLSNIVAVSGGGKHSLALRADGVVVGWGDNDSGQITAPAGLSNVIGVAAGGSHSLALRADGKVVAWGRNVEGQVNVPPNLTNAVAVAAGGYHSLALRADGTVVAWGANNYNQIMVPAELSNVVGVAAGEFHSLAQRSDGTVVVWGWNKVGQTNTPGGLGDVVSIAGGLEFNLALLGEGAPWITAQPISAATKERSQVILRVQATGQWPLNYQWYHNGMPIPDANKPWLLLSGVQLMDAGAYEVVVGNAMGAVTSTVATLEVEPVPQPQVVAWGNNAAGQLNVPVDLTNVLQIAAGWSHSLALRTDGTVTAWGSNSYGQTNVPAGLSNVVMVAAGENHSVAVRADGTVVAWGRNNYGQTNVPADLSNVVAVAAGQLHTLALRADGTVVAWGGVGYATDVPAGLSDVIAVAAGGHNSVALRADGMIVEWGEYVAPERGGAPAIRDVVAISGGGYHFLALRANGTVVAWGGNDMGQTNVPLGLSNVVAISSGWRNSLALRADGTVVAWGANDYGQLNLPLGLSNVVGMAAGAYHGLALVGKGAPTITSQPLSITVPKGRNAILQVQASGQWPLNYQWYFNGLPIPAANKPWLWLPDVQEMNAGAYQVVVGNGMGTVTSSVAVVDILPPVNIWGWGYNYAGSYAAPWAATGVVAVAAGANYGLALRRDGTVVGWGGDWMGGASGAAGLSDVVAISAGLGHGLAVLADGTVAAWGDNSHGQINVPPSLGNVVSVVAADYYSLALRSDGTVVAWGDNADGQTAVPADLRSVIAVAGGYNHSIALRADGTVVGWGDNEFGQTDAPPDLNDAVAVAAANSFSVALRANGTVVVWGDNYWGQTNVPPGLSNVVGVVAGGDCIAALQDDGTVVVWGDDSYGKTDVPPALNNVAGVSVNWDFGMALLGEGAPWVGTRPMTLTVAEGGKAILSVEATGQWPLSYQWYHNGMPITGANKPWFVVSEVQPGNVGEYEVVVANAMGAVTSVVATLQLEGEPMPSQVVAWGYNLYGQTNVPPNLTDVVGVAGGEHHSLALRRDGTVVAWGDNAYSQGSVPPWVSNVTQISAAYAHNLALTDGGALLLWGDNSMHQLDVPVLWDSVLAISANAAHNLALLANGNVVAWGANFSGQCNVPVDATNVIAVSAGEDFSLALRADGTVVGWGDNVYGQATPPPWLSNVVAIAAGGNHSLALIADGTVVGWGNNDLGQINVPAGLSNVVAIAAGGTHSVALKGDGTVVVWGYESNGQLAVPAGLGDVVGVAAGYGHLLAIVGNGPPLLSLQRTWRQATVGGTVVFAGQAVGEWPLHYQWYFNEVPIPGANKPWLVLQGVDVFFTDGFFVLEVSNAVGVVYSEPMSLEVHTPITEPPIITQHPESQTARAGSSVTFDVVVESAYPVAYQWFFNGNGIGGATQATLTLPSVRKSDEGYYSVQVINLFGTATSFPAYLAVIEQDPYITINGVFKADGRHLLQDNSPVWVTMETAYANGSIYYSTNNLHPDDGALYTGPFEVVPPLVLKAIAYNSNRTEWTGVVTNRLEIGWEFPLMLSTPGGGTVTVSPAPGPYASNSVVTLTASPAPGWTFMRWEGDVTGSNAVTQVVMNRPRQAQAIFGTTVPLAIQGSGIVQFDPPERVFPYGIRVRLSALPNAGHYFQQWTVGAGTVSQSPLDLVLTNPGPSVVARFSPLPFNTYALNTLVVGGGKVLRLPSANFYTNGTPVLLTAMPDPGFIFIGWSGDLQGTNASQGLVVNGNRTVTAHFMEANRLAIVAQPRSQVVQVGATVVLSVRAIGQNISYQWFHNGLPVEGGQSSDLVLANVTSAQAGAYQVLVYNDLGDYLESDVALLTVNREANPQVQSLLFLGTAADEAARAVTIISNEVYVGGLLNVGAGEGFGVKVPVNFASNTPPVWQTLWPGRPGPDGFMGVLGTPLGPVFAGFSEPFIQAVAGTAKGVLVQLSATNGQEVFARRTPLGGAFDYDGDEMLNAITSSKEPGGEFWYVTGIGQSAAESYGQMFLAKVMPGGGNVWVASEVKPVTATETLGAVNTPGFAVDFPVEYSVGNAVLVMGGAVYVAGRSDLEGMPYATLWKFSLDGRLLWRQFGSIGEYRGLAAMNGILYAAGTAQNFWSGEDFLVERWNPEGWMEWSAIYDRAEEDDGLTAVVASSGRLYACGYTYGGTMGGADAVVLRLDPENGELLSTLIQGYFQDDFAHAMVMSGQFLYVAGETSSGGAGGVDAVLIRLFVPDLVPNVEPQVAFISPADGEQFVAPATIPLEITATDADDAIRMVRLYKDGALLANLSSAPYRMTLTNLPAGEYVFGAIAEDTRGASTFAAPVKVVVNNYLASHKLDFEPVVLLPAGTSTPLTLSNYLAGFEARVVNMTPGSTVQVVRATQVYPGMVKPSSGSNILEQVSSNRGPVTNRFEFEQVLDSVRFTRVAVLAGSAGANHPQWRARAFNRFGMELSSVGENALFSPQDIPARTFTLNGPDIAAVVFESNAQGMGRFGSLLLDDLVLNVAISSNSAPLVVITSPAQKERFAGPADVTVRVLAEDYDGEVNNVSLWVNDVPVDFALNSRPGRFEPSFVLSNLVVGTYRLVAVAYDDVGASRESVPVSFSVVAPVPANDNFANALVLTGITATASGNSAGASFEPGEPYHAGVPGGRSVWFAWTAPQDGLVTVTTAGSTFDTVLAVYTGGGLISFLVVESNDDDPTQTDALTSRLWFTARRGQVYYIAVDGYNGAGGFYSLLVSMNLPPVVSLLEPLPGAIYSAPGPITLRARAEDADGVARVEFYRGNALVGVATNQPPGTPFVGQVTLTNVAPGEYYFRARAVDAAGVTAETLPVRVVVRVPAADNDMFANARALSGPVVLVTNDNRSATLEPDEPDPWGGLGGKSLWYRWTAPASGTVLISTLGSSFDTLLTVYTGSTLQNLQLVALDDDSGEEITSVVGLSDGGASLINMDVTAGTTYYISVEGFLGAGGNVRLSLAFNIPPVVQLTINTNLAQFNAPGIIPLVATVVDDQVVKRVDFFMNEDLVGVVVNPLATNRFTATLTLTNLSAGEEYLFSARAVDDMGAVTWTPPLPVRIIGIEEEPEVLAEAAEVEVVRGEKIELKVRARGTPPLLYQWFFNGLPLWGANSATLVIPNATPANSGRYFVRVSNAYGFEDGEETQVRVFVPPVITVPPASVTLPPGTSAVFTVTAVGTPPLRYQWYRHLTPLPGATGSTLIITNVSPWEMGAYTVVVSNRAGQAQATAQLTVSAVLAPPASVPREDFWVPDGPVHAVAESAGTLYIGGNFRMVGPNTGLGVALNASSAQPDNVWPRVEGTAIYAVVPDGEGGWFVGGDFVRVGGLPRTNLVHILPDNTVDPAWVVAVNGPVRALLVDDQVLYVGGEFTQVGDQTRTNLAAVRVQDGILRSMAPNPDGVVLALAKVDSKLYVGGAFQTIGGVPRARLAKVDPSDGEVRTDFVMGFDRAVHALLVDDQRLFVAGEFDTVTNNNLTYNRPKIALVDTEDREVLGWQAPLPSGTGARVYALAMLGDTVYVGGDFSFASGGVTYRHLAAFSRSDGALQAWNPGAGGVVRALAAGSDAVYAGGLFLTMGGQTRLRLAAVHPTTGAVLDWQAPANGAVRALALRENTLLAGGQFTLAGGVMRSNVAALRLATGQTTSWNPGANGPVRAIAVSGTNVYLGGEFTIAGRQSRSNLAAISVFSSDATAWNPGANSAVRAFALSGKRLFVGGDFTVLAGAARSYLGAVDMDTAAPLDWNPTPDGRVLALRTTANGAQIYVAGEFNAFNGTSRPYLARVDSSGALDGWSPSPNAPVMALALRETPTPVVYVGGAFSQIGGAARQRLAALDNNGMVLQAFAPQVQSATGDVAVVRAVQLRQEAVDFGGWFHVVDGVGRQHLASLAESTGALADWNPDLTVPSQALGVQALAAVTNVMVVGGDFTRVAGNWRPNLAVFVPRGAPIIVGQPQGRVVPLGATHTLRVTAQGAWPLYFQWRLNGVNLPNATNATLVLTNIQLAQCGAYSVVASTPYGVAESLPAELLPEAPVVTLGDRFTNAFSLSLTATGLVRSQNTEATGLQDDQLPGGFKRGGRAVWATWVAPTNGVVTFSTLGSTFDTLLTVLQGNTLNSMVVVERDEDSAGNLNERVTFPVTQGNVYHVLVDGVEGASGVIVLSWNLQVGVTDYPIITDQPRSRTVPENSPVTLQVTAQNAQSYQWLYRGQPISGATGSSYIIPALTRALAGPYQVIAYGSQPDRRAQSRVFVLEVGQLVQSNQTVVLEDVRTHDKFDDMLRGTGPGGQTLGGPQRQFFASVSAGSSGTQVLDNYGATTEPNEPDHGGVVGGASRWFRIDTLTNGILVIDTIGSEIDTVLAVYTGESLFTLELVASDDNGAPDGVRSLVRFNAQSGKSYLVAVDGVNGAEGHIVMNYLLAEPPAVVSQPVNQSIASGGSASFSVTASGSAPLSYQWYHLGVGQTNRLPVTGGTNAVLSLTNVQAGAAGTYNVVVSNPAASVTSAVATLTVEAPLRFAAGGAGSYSNGVFTLNISGKAGQMFIIQASTNLSTWTPISTNLATGGQVQFADPGAGTVRRFYRAVGLE